ncbi:MAG: toxin-antitoxin system protein [Acidobacteria bacterium]|nr:MAG: toxin-antitoxin system protein [Acidobacteriota bacterium]
MVWIKNEDHHVLKELAELAGESMSNVLANALDDYRRKHFLKGLSDDFASLRSSESEWTEELGERELWASAVSDDLEES